MDAFPRRIFRAHTFPALSSANFFLALHIFFVIFLNSSYLGKFGDEAIVSMLFATGSAISIVSLVFVPRIIPKTGVFAFTVLLASLEIFVVLGLATAQNLTIAGTLFVLYWSITILLLYSLDLFIESVVLEENSTGFVRGVVLTITNTALLLSPMGASVVVEAVGFSTAYVIAGLFILPFLLILTKQSRQFDDPLYEPYHFFKAFRHMLTRYNVRALLLLHLLLRVFFAVTVVYLPVYLHVTVGFSWPEIGAILSLMLVPMALFEFPIGRILTTNKTERIFLLLGFSILSSFVIIIGLVGQTNIAIWGALLFIVHIGASMVEITSETAFFSRVGGKDTDLISFFRMLRPFGYVIGTFIGAVAYSMGGVLFCVYCNRNTACFRYPYLPCDSS